MEKQSGRHIVVNGPYIAHAEIDTLILAKGDVYTAQKPSRYPTEGEDVEYEEQSPEAKPDYASYFPYLTKKCFDENRVTTVEAEIQAARKGTAEDMWRTLWTNENLGYLEVKFIDATTLYRAIEKWYGKLPYTDRNFRGARSKR